MFQKDNDFLFTLISKEQNNCKKKGVTRIPGVPVLIPVMFSVSPTRFLRSFFNEKFLNRCYVDRGRYHRQSVITIMQIWCFELFFFYYYESVCVYFSVVSTFIGSWTCVGFFFESYEFVKMCKWTRSDSCIILTHMRRAVPSYTIRNVHTCIPPRPHIRYLYIYKCVVVHYCLLDKGRSYWIGVCDSRHRVPSFFVFHSLFPANHLINIQTKSLWWTHRVEGINRTLRRF